MGFPVKTWCVYCIRHLNGIMAAPESALSPLSAEGWEGWGCLYASLFSVYA